MTDRRRPITPRTTAGAHDRLDQVDQTLTDLADRLRASTLPEPLEFRRVSPSAADAPFGVQVVDGITGQVIVEF